MIIDVDGQKFDVPDDATPDEIDGLTRPKFAGATPRQGAQSVVDSMGPIEGRLAAFGEHAAHTLKQGGNLIGNIAESVSGKRLGMPTDAEVQESAELNAPLREKYPIVSFGGAVAPQLLPVGGGGAAVARAGLGSRLANIGTQAAIGAGQGYTFSDPGQRGTNAAVGGAVGGTVAAVANPLAALARRALDRADEGAYKLFEPTIEKLKELAEKGAKRGQSAEQGMRNFGRQIRETVDPGTGRRLVDPVAEIGDRALATGRVGARGGRQIDAALKEMDFRGLKGRPSEVRQQLIQARDELLGTGDFATFTPTQRRSLMTINKQISDFDRVFGTKLELDPIIGTKPAETAPLTMTEHPETGALVRPRTLPGNPAGERVIAESRVGSADELWRSKTATPVPAEEAVTRAKPLKRNQYLPEEEILPEREGIIGAKARLEDLPLSDFESRAKRLLGKEGFQRSGSSKYRTAEAAEGDPAIEWLRRATGILKDHTEKQFAPQYFLEGKKMAALDEILGPAAKDAAVSNVGRGPGTGGSLQGFVFRHLVRPAVRKARPYGIKANEAIDAVAKALPHNTDAALRAAVIEMLRQKETQ